MRERRFLSWILISVAFAIVAPAAVVAAVSPSQPRDPDRSIAVTQAQARTAFVDFVGKVNSVGKASVLGVAVSHEPRADALRLSDSMDGSFASFYEVAFEYGSGRVDIHTGKVIGLNLYDNLPSTTDLLLSTDDALVVASSFVSSSGIDVKGLTPRVSVLEHLRSKEYLVEWGAMSGDVVLPVHVAVRVNPQTGSVVGFDDVRHSHRPFVAASVSASDAQAAARARFPGVRTEVSKTSLELAYTLSGQQKLVWRISIVIYPYDKSPAHSSYEIGVDAQTGALTSD
jgi:Peptidase propeptide and YPEB domain